MPTGRLSERQASVLRSAHGDRLVAEVEALASAEILTAADVVELVALFAPYDGGVHSVNEDWLRIWRARHPLGEDVEACNELVLILNKRAVAATRGTSDPLGPEWVSLLKRAGDFLRAVQLG